MRTLITVLLALMMSTQISAQSEPRLPKPEPARPDPLGCRATCGSKTCCVALQPAIAWDSPLVKSGLHPAGDFPYVLPRDPKCPRIDLVSLNPQMSAINVNGRTVGHFRGLTLTRNAADPVAFTTGQLAYSPPIGDGHVRPRPCTPVPFPFEIDPTGKTLSINGTAVGAFQSFLLSADAAAALGTQPGMARLGSVTLDASNLNNDAIRRMMLSADGRWGGAQGTIGAGPGTNVPSGSGGTKPSKPCPQGKFCAE